MNGLDKTFPNMRCRSLNNYVTSALKSVGYQEVSDDDDPPFFPNQLFFFFIFGPPAQFTVVTKCVFVLEIYT